VTTDAALGEVLVRENLMTSAQLKTALEFQKSLGGDLRTIVVKLGYVKDTVLADLVAAEEHVSASAAELTIDVLDFDTIRAVPRAVLEKHQVVPLRSDDGGSIVLAMADPNDLRAIEEIQFLVNRPVEPAVAAKAAIRKALNQLPELVKQFEQKQQQDRPAPRSGPMPVDRLKAVKDLPLEKLLRAFIVLQVERGQLSIDDLLARAAKL
jgi:type IV pilus assembly protein PilB